MKNKRYCVYKHTSPSNKVYIGITCKVPAYRRWNLDGSGYKDNDYFWKAIKKYGWNNFKHEILYENLTKAEACKIEKRLIKQYKSNIRKYGYNIAIGGEGASGVKLSRQARQKMSEAAIKKYTSLRADPIKWEKFIKQNRLNQQKASLKNTGQKRSIESKNKMSQSAKKAWKNKSKEQYDLDCQHLKLANKGMKIYNNGIDEVRIKPDMPIPDGYILGRLKKGNWLSKTILVLDLDFNIIGRYESAQEADRQLGLPATTAKNYAKLGCIYKKKYKFVWEKDYEESKK